MLLKGEVYSEITINIASGGVVIDIQDLVIQQYDNNLYYAMIKIGEEVALHSLTHRHGYTIRETIKFLNKRGIYPTAIVVATREQGVPWENSRNGLSYTI